MQSLHFPRAKPQAVVSDDAGENRGPGRILSGVFEGRTLGTPISMLVWNEDQRPEAYADFKDKFRPSHADF